MLIEKYMSVLVVKESSDVFFATPLEVRLKASSFVAKSLMEAYPKFAEKHDDLSGLMPLYDACGCPTYHNMVQILLETSQTIPKILYNNGDLEIYGVVANAASPDIAKMSHEVYPETARVKINT